MLIKILEELAFIVELIFCCCLRRNMYNTTLQLITYSGLETEFIDIAWYMVAHAVWSIHVGYSESGLQWRHGMNLGSIARDTPDSLHVCCWAHLWLLHIYYCHIFMPPVFSYVFPSVLLTHILRSWIVLAYPVFPYPPVNQFQRTLNCVDRLSQQWPYFLVPTFCISYFSFAVAKYPTGSNLRAERSFLAFRLEWRLRKAWLTVLTEN